MGVTGLLHGIKLADRRLGHPERSPKGEAKDLSSCERRFLVGRRKSAINLTRFYLLFLELDR